MGGGTEHPKPAGDPCPVLPLSFTPNLTASLMRGFSFRKPLFLAKPNSCSCLKELRAGSKFVPPLLTLTPNVASVLGRGGPHSRPPPRFSGRLLPSPDDPEKEVSVILYAHLGHCDQSQHTTEGVDTIPREDHTSPTLRHCSTVQDGAAMNWKSSSNVECSFIPKADIRG